MTDRVFTYTWTDSKRLTVLHALGFMYAKLKTCPVAVTETVEGLIGELSITRGQDTPAPHPQTETGGTEAARAVLAPTPVDTFARTRKGDVQLTAPEGAEFSMPGIVGRAKTEKYLKVILAHAGTANCFDPELRALIEKFDGKKPLGLWIKKSDNGKYQNIVGVRA